MNIENLKHEVTVLHAELCSAVADPNRLMIVYALAKEDKNVNTLAEEIGLSPSATSRHLKILRDKDFVRAERTGHHVYYSLTTPQLIQALDLFLEILNDQLAHRANLIQTER